MAWQSLDLTEAKFSLLLLSMLTISDCLMEQSRLNYPPNVHTRKYHQMKGKKGTSVLFLIFAAINIRVGEDGMVRLSSHLSTMPHHRQARTVAEAE